MILEVALVFCHFAVAQGAVFSWDFSDCEIKDILFAVSVDTGISIVPDDTVSGKGDLKFAGGDFDLAFEAFLKTNRLFVERDGSVWTVSRCHVAVENGCFSLEAYDLLPVQIVEKLSLVMDKVVTYESLPAQRISVCFRGVDETLLMDCLAKRFGLYGVERDAAGYHFVRNSNVRASQDLAQRAGDFSGMANVEVLENGGVEDARLAQADPVFESGVGENTLCQYFAISVGVELAHVNRITDTPPMQRDRSVGGLSHRADIDGFDVVGVGLHKDGLHDVFRCRDVYL